MPAQQNKIRSGVRATSVQYNEMKERWELCYALWGGTKSMREAREIYLPKNPLESEKKYEQRLRSTFLYNAYKRAIETMVGSAFSRPINVSNLPVELEPLVKNADGSGQSLTAIAALTCRNILISGKGHLFVDFPETGGVVTVSDVIRGEKMPIINVIDPRDLIGWRSEYNQGREKITEIRFVEKTIEFAEEFYDLEVERVRVVRPHEFVIYSQNTDFPKNQGTTKKKASEFVPEKEGVNTLGSVPVVTVYSEKENTFVSYPPLEDLAWLNLRHWQSSSEQSNILHVARVPILFGKCLGGEEGSIQVGSDSAVHSDSPEAELKYVEHTGQAINAGKDDLRALEDQMAHMGSDVLTSKSVSRQTATGREIDKAESMSTFQVILRNLEAGLEEAIRLAGDWINVDASKVKVSIGEDLSLVNAEANPVESLEKLTEKGVLTEQEEITELKRRGVLSPNVTEQ